MVNNITNVNKMNNHLSPQLIDHKTDHDHVMFEIQVLAWDSHTNVVGLNHVMRSQCSPHDN